MWGISSLVYVDIHRVISQDKRIVLDERPTLTTIYYFQLILHPQKIRSARVCSYETSGV